MILKCNSCEKKFVVPDKAVTAAGRLVQCGSCGNKWKQFPLNDEIKKTTINKGTEYLQPLKVKKINKKKVKKTREFNLYSPEYLAKKHGINLDDVKADDISRDDNKVSFGFYNSLFLFFFFLIAFSKGLHFFQDFIVFKAPFMEYYLSYFFENIKNIFEIGKNLFLTYSF